MKYPPGSRILDPVAWVIENVSPVSQHDDWLLNIKLKNHSAVDALMKGHGNRQALTDVVAMFNMTRSMMLRGFGVDLTSIILDAERAIPEYTRRIQLTRSYTLKPHEITALKALLELHDAQMEVATVGEVHAALEHARREFQGGKCTRLSTQYIGDLPAEL
jgi:hypothetical protein